MSILVRDDIAQLNYTGQNTGDATAIDETPSAPEMPRPAYRYQVEVKKQGCYVACHVVKAIDALSAINQVELLYGGPVELADGSIEDKQGKRHHILVANNWHGYTYQAKKINLPGKV